MFAALSDSVVGVPGCGSVEVRAMIEGTLNRMQSGRWAVCRSGMNPIEIKSGDAFSVEVGGRMRPTRMQFVDDRGYYSVDGYALKSGLRAAITLQ
jgi:hypothetical protein